MSGLGAQQRLGERGWVVSERVGIVEVCGVGSIRVVKSLGGAMGRVCCGPVL